MSRRQLPLTRFRMNSIKFRATEKSEGPIIIAIGRRGTGKSVLTRDLLYHFRDVPVGTVISGTEEGNGFFGRMMPRCLIHDEFKVSTIEGVYQSQKQRIRARNRDLERFGQSEIDPRTFLVMDDCLYDESWSRERIMRMLFMNGRHWMTMVLITLQYPLGLPPVMRSNVDYTFVLREPSRRNRRIIYDNFASCFSSMDAFEQVLEQTTANFECMVIHNSSHSNLLHEQVFFYLANINIPPFRLCSQEYWDLNAKIMAERGDDEQNQLDELNSADFDRTRRGPNIVVTKREAPYQHSIRSIGPHPAAR